MSPELSHAGKNVYSLLVTILCVCAWTSCATVMLQGISLQPKMSFVQTTESSNVSFRAHFRYKFLFMLLERWFKVQRVSLKGGSLHIWTQNVNHDSSCWQPRDKWTLGGQFDTQHRHPFEINGVHLHWPVVKIIIAPRSDSLMTRGRARCHRLQTSKPPITKFVTPRGWGSHGSTEGILRWVFKAFLRGRKSREFASLVTSQSHPLSSGTMFSCPFS